MRLVPFGENKNSFTARQVKNLIALAADKSGNQQVTALALYQLDDIGEQLSLELSEEKSTDRRSHLVYMLNEISQFRQHPKDYQPPAEPELPEGSPIGCER
jgi:hypothetical protein